ncbi:hypothetical protein HMPREF9120_02641 [Neisseria sp. oral taxon 020 str. F0370]|nr:hypothetical protein HMPREF9120_02641 [Neisseria sp. oral taxon 020 str. F0370]
MTISVAAVFLAKNTPCRRKNEKIPACRVKNARKVSNLATLFSLHSGIFYSKTRLAS